MSLGELWQSGLCVHFAQALAHFVWQALLIAGAAAAAGWRLRRASARARYAVYLAALVVMAACLPATFAALHRHAAGPPRPAPAATAAVDARPVAEAVPARPPLPAAAELPPPVPRGEGEGASAMGGVRWRHVAPYATAAYLLGVVAMFGRLLVALRGGQRLRRDSVPVDDRALVAFVGRQARALGLRLVPVVAWCERIVVPVVVGMLRPAILVPVSLATGLTAEQLQAVLAHELAHIRRHDHLVLVVQRVVESLLFFHPAVWFVSRRLNVEREHCCDDLAVEAGSARAAYAESLVRVMELCRRRRGVRPASAVALASGRGRAAEFAHRVLRIVGAADASPVRLRRVWALLLAALLATGAGVWVGLRAQAAGPEEGEAEPKALEACQATLPDGVTVALIGVSNYPSKGQPWWRPDGTPLAHPPYDPSSVDIRSEIGRDTRTIELALELGGEAALPAWEADVRQRDGKGVLWAGKRTRKRRFFLIGIKSIATDVRADQETLDLDLRIAAGPWQLVLTAARGAATFEHKLGAVAFLPAKADGQRTLIQVTTPLALGEALDWRVVAVDRAGKAHDGHRHDVTVLELPVEEGVERRWQEYRYEMPLDQIREFRFETRPFHDLALRQVSLTPGHKTAARVVAVTARPPDAPPKADVRDAETMAPPELPPARDAERDVIVQELRKIVALREKEVERIRKLVAAKVTTQRELDQAELALAEARIRLAERLEKLGAAAAPGPGPKPEAREPAPPAAEQADIELRGLVVDAETGEPVERFVLQTGWPDPIDPTEAVWGGTHDSASRQRGGLFSTGMRCAVGRKLWVRVLADGYLPEPVTPAPVAAPGRAVDLFVRLKRGGEIVGRVVDHQGTPVAGATVLLGGHQACEVLDGEVGRFAGSRAVTDADGHFVLQGGGGDANRLIVVTPSLHVWNVAAPEAGQEATVRLPEPATLVLRYAIEGDEPEAHCQLRLRTWAMDGWKSLVEVRQHLTAANGGEVVLRNVTPGVYDLARVKVLRAGDYGIHVPCDRRTVALKPGETLQVAFARPKGHPIVGQVSGLPEGGVPGVFVYLSPAEDPARPGGGRRQTTLDALTCEANGRFKTARIPPGRYTLRAEAYRPDRGYSGRRRPDFVGGATVEVREEAPPPEVRIEMKPSAAPAPPADDADAGWGEPVEGVQLRLRAEKTVWREGERPKFIADLRNQGERDLKLIMAAEYWELRVDGTWYRVTVVFAGTVGVRPFGPGRRYDNVLNSLASPACGWKSKDGDKPLVFTPGKHTVQAAFTAYPRERGAGKPVRVVSNPLAIEILPAEPPPRAE